MSHTDPHATPRDPSHPHGALDNVDVAHEHTDINVRAIIGFLVALFAVVAGVYVLMYGLFVVFDRQAMAHDAAPSPVARPIVEMPVRSVDPYFSQGEGPRLLTDEPAALAKQRAMEAEALGTYGWRDEQAGIARMPIGEAKKLIVQRGVPARADGAADAALGTRRAAYGESSSGRAITARPDEYGPTAPPPSAAPAPAAPHKGHD